MRLPDLTIGVASVALAMAAAPGCRKTERLPSRPEEREVPDGSSAPVVGDVADVPVAPPPAPPSLRAPGREPPERVEFPAADGVVLVGDWFSAPGPAPAPVVVLVHGENGRRTDWQPFVERLLATPTARLAVLAIDLRGHGESVRAPGRTLAAERLQRDAAAAPNAWAGVVADVDAALAWVRERRDVGAQAVLVGVGVGAVASARAAAGSPGGPGGRGRVVGLVALSPGEEYGVSFGAGTFEKLEARGVRAFAVAAEDDAASAPAGLLAIEAGLGVTSTDDEVFATGGRGLALLAARPDVFDRALAFVVRSFGVSADVTFEAPDGAPLRALVDRSLDPGGPVVVVVPDLGRGYGSLRRLTAELRRRLPYDIVVCQPTWRRAAEPEEADAGSGGAPDAGGGEGGPAEVARWVGEIAAVVRAEVSGAAEDDAAVGPLPQRSGWVLVGFGWGATVAALAAGELVEDASLPPLRGLVLVSATANGRGVSIWPALGEHVRARGVPVFAAAASRAAIDVEAQRTGMGADARTVRTIQSMFRGEAVVRIYPSGARAEALINLHVDLAPAIAGFAGDVLRPARLTAQPP